MTSVKQFLAGTGWGTSGIKIFKKNASRNCAWPAGVPKTSNYFLVHNSRYITYGGFGRYPSFRLDYREFILALVEDLKLEMGLLGKLLQHDYQRLASAINSCWLSKM